jgi:hypothetical protein
MSDESRDMDLTPESNMVLALCEANLHWRTALGELIDNAFDAGATNVSIAIEGKGASSKFVIRDNGSGCKNLVVLFKPGARDQQATTRLGRWGVGAKDAMLCIGGAKSTVRATSVHGGIHRSAQVNWDLLVKSGNWKAQGSAPQSRTAAADERGTTIVVTPVAKQIPEGKRWEALLDDLGYQYSPAIKRGMQITITRGKGVPEPIKRYESPPLEPGHIDVQIEVGGKKARVYFGIVQQSAPNKRAGITYTHDFRVIIPASGYGCGGFDYTRVAGIVDLDESWVLTKNKDGISSHVDDLFEEVFRVCRPLLQKAEVIGQKLESAAFDNDVERSVNESIFGREKAKREDGNEHGTRTPTGKGGKHKRAEQTQDGDTFARLKRSSSLRIIYSDEESEAIGRFSRPNAIILHSKHPFVRTAREKQNKLAIVVIAASLVGVDVIDAGAKQMVIRGILNDGSSTKERVETAISTILRNVRLDGQSMASESTAETSAP